MEDIQEEFRQLYNAYRPRLLGFFLKRTGDRDLAEDLTQEVFLRVMRYWASFDPARGERGAWLFGVAANAYKSYLAGRGRIEDPGLEEGQLVDELRRSPADEVEASVTAREILVVVADLPEPERSVLSLHRLEGKTLEETAAITGLSRRTVSRKMAGALSVLKERLRLREIRLE